MELIERVLNAFRAVPLAQRLELARRLVGEAHAVVERHHLQVLYDDCEYHANDIGGGEFGPKVGPAAYAIADILAAAAAARGEMNDGE